MNLYMPPLPAEEFEKGQGTQKTFSISLKDPVAQQRVGKADSLVEPDLALALRGYFDIKFLEQLGHAQTSDFTR